MAELVEPTGVAVHDALPDWPGPEAQSEWYGSVEAEQAMRSAYLGGHLHHAWLITGLKGIGKATLAFRFARFVLANPDPSAVDAEPSTMAVPRESRVARSIAAGAHPNLLVLRRPWDDQTKRFRTALTVDEVRRIRSFFGSTAGGAGHRVCIVDTADDLNISAANALLKMLEEPPDNGLFLLVANQPGQLLPTIRSRCRRLDLKPLTVEAIQAALRSRGGNDAAEIGLAAALAGGSLRRAIQFLDSDGAETYRAFANIVSRLPEVDYTAVHELADMVAVRGRDDAYEAFLEMVDDWLSRRVRRKPEPVGSLSAAVEAASLASWAGVWEKVRESALQAQTLNLDRKQVILQVFMALADATRM
jgi:DNA polymerase-3 subunit delta'